MGMPDGDPSAASVGGHSGLTHKFEWDESCNGSLSDWFPRPAGLHESRWHTIQFRPGRSRLQIATSMKTYDVVIIGAGHNGLTCAAYLGMAGLKVKVLERRPVVGGAAVTEEFHPGFRNSVAAYTVSLLNPKVIADLDLLDHGLRIVERRAQNFLPTRMAPICWRPKAAPNANIAKFSARDAERYDAFNRELDAVADVLRELVLQAPPNLRAGSRCGRARRTAAPPAPGQPAAPACPPKNLRTLLDLFTKVRGRLSRRLVRGRSGQGAVSASTPSSAITPAPTRRAPPTCCCIMPSAR